MMKSETLIHLVLRSTETLIEKAEQFKTYDLSQLNKRPGPNQWSMLECLEHLNRYAEYYNAEINRAIENSNSTASLEFRSGWLGNYFSESMKPKAKLNKMKTMKAMNPIGSDLDISVIDRFVALQIDFIKLLNKGKHSNLNKVYITTSLSRWIKMKLGDTFLFLNNHNLRHFEQINRLLPESRN